MEQNFPVARRCAKPRLRILHRGKVDLRRETDSRSNRIRPSCQLCPSLCFSVRIVNLASLCKLTSGDRGIDGRALGPVGFCHMWDFLIDFFRMGRYFIYGVSCGWILRQFFFFIIIIIWWIKIGRGERKQFLEDFENCEKFNYVKFRILWFYMEFSLISVRMGKLMGIFK